LDQSTEGVTASQAEADLALIRKMMSAGRKRAGIDGSHLVLWGAVLAVTFLAQYLMSTGIVPRFHIEAWVVAIVTGSIASSYLGRKMGPQYCGPNPTLTGYVSAWQAVGLTMVLYFVTSILSGETDNRTISILSSGVMGSAFFVMARVIITKPLYFAAFGWWAIMIYDAQLAEIHVETLLVKSIACVFLVLFPGLFLKRLSSAED